MGHVARGTWNNPGRNNLNNMTEPKNYKDTLNLPQTSFPMKANLAQREPEMLKNWETEGVYAAIRAKSEGKPKYILHDGPPYANGHIHIGHALNKVLKDLIVKYKTMRGHDALYVPGWDCHGLPIEHACLKEMGKRKEEVDRVEFRKQARKYAESLLGSNAKGSNGSGSSANGKNLILR